MGGALGLARAGTCAAQATLDMGHSPRKYMNSNPLILADKIAAFIIKEKGASYGAIKARASEKAIDPLVLEQALERLHRNPMIHRTMSGGDVQYSVKVVKPVGVATYVTWVRNNYPWPQDFVMPFPEIDMSWMFLRTLEERQAYKEAAAGRHVAAKWYETA